MSPRPPPLAADAEPAVRPARERQDRFRPGFAGKPDAALTQRKIGRRADHAAGRERLDRAAGRRSVIFGSLLPNRLVEAAGAVQSATGLKASFSAMFDSRSASCFSTSSNCLPPMTALRKRIRHGAAKAVALLAHVVHAKIHTIQRASQRRHRRCRGVRSSAIGISRHQFGKLGIGRAARCARSHRLDRKRKLARRHRQNACGDSRRMPSPKPIASSQGKVSWRAHVGASAEGRCDQLAAMRT